jgi:hypothetical protein
MSADDFVGAHQERLGKADAEGLGRGQVDHELDPGRQLHRKIGGPRALRDPVDVHGEALVHVLENGPVGEEVSRARERRPAIDDGDSGLQRERLEAAGEAEREAVGESDDRSVAAAPDLGEGALRSASLCTGKWRMLSCSAAAALCAASRSFDSPGCCGLAITAIWRIAGNASFSTCIRLPTSAR